MAKTKKSKSKKTKKNKVINSGVLWGGNITYPLYDFPVFRAPRGPIEYPVSCYGFTPREEVIKLSIHRLFNVASIAAFGAAALGHVLFGHGGLELVAAGLALHVGADVAEDVLVG